MIEIEKRGNIIYTYASGKLSNEDYDKILPIIKKTIEKHGKIRWCFQVDRFEGWSPQSLWRDFKFDVKYRNDVTKVAIVGEERWQDWMTQMMKPFTSAEVRYFDEIEKDKAENWIEYNEPKISTRKRIQNRSRIRTVNKEKSDISG